MEWHGGTKGQWADWSSKLHDPDLRPPITVKPKCWGLPARQRYVWTCNVPGFVVGNSVGSIRMPFAETLETFFHLAQLLLCGLQLLAGGLQVRLRGLQLCFGQLRHSGCSFGCRFFRFGLVGLALLLLLLLLPRLSRAFTESRGRQRRRRSLLNLTILAEAALG